VIAIIAILAAILFPVFARARGKARSASCLSNCKQIGNAFLMYTQDYDEIGPAQWSGSGVCGGGGTCRQEWWNGLFPYIKSVEALYCPERIDGSAANYNVVERALGITRYTGYGYNWGPIGWRGGGLLKDQQPAPSGGGQTFLPGRPMSAVVSPAATYAYGDTYDTPRMTIGIGFSADTWMRPAGAPSCSGSQAFRNDQLRHGGVFNYGFVDGHAKAINVRAGFMNGAFNCRFIMPRDPGLAATAYCADPAEIIVNNTAGNSDGTGVPSPIACGAVAAFVATYPPCAPGATSGRCFFP